MLLLLILLIRVDKIMVFSCSASQVKGILDFFSSLISCFAEWINFLFRYSIGGIPLGVYIVSCLVFIVIVHYILGSMR